MAKNKQQKQKERERRVAREKLAATQKRAQKKKTTKETPKTDGARSKKLTSAVAAPKADYVAANKKSPFTQRRGGG